MVWPGTSDYFEMGVPNDSGDNGKTCSYPYSMEEVARREGLEPRTLRFEAWLVGL